MKNSIEILNKWLRFLILIVIIFVIIFISIQIRNTVLINNIKYSADEYEMLEKVEVIDTGNNTNIVKTENREFTLSDVDVYKHIDDEGLVIVDYCDYILYIRDKKDYYKVNELKEIHYPWEGKEEIYAFRDIFYDEVKSYIGLKFEEIREKYKITEGVNTDELWIIPFLSLCF